MAGEPRSQPWPDSSRRARVPHTHTHTAELFGLYPLPRDRITFINKRCCLLIAGEFRHSPSKRAGKSNSCQTTSQGFLFPPFVYTTSSISPTGDKRTIHGLLNAPSKPSSTKTLCGLHHDRRSRARVQTQTCSHCQGRPKTKLRPQNNPRCGVQSQSRTSF